MEELSRAGARLHKVSMINRQTCTISGVNDVISFDIHEILLETEHRLSLDQGEIDMDGRIDSLTYLAGVPGNKTDSFLARLFQ